MATYRFRALTETTVANWHAMDDTNRRKALLREDEMSERCAECGDEDFDMRECEECGCLVCRDCRLWGETIDVCCETCWGDCYYGDYYEDDDE